MAAGPSDPWQNGTDPWANKRLPGSENGPPIHVAPPPGFTDFAPKRRGNGLGLADALLSDASKGNKGKGAGRGQIGRGVPKSGAGARVSATQKTRDWHVLPTAQPPAPETKPQCTVSVGRGRSLVEPAWKTSSGLCSQDPAADLQPGLGGSFGPLEQADEDDDAPPPWDEGEDSPQGGPQPPSLPPRLSTRPPPRTGRDADAPPLWDAGIGWPHHDPQPPARPPPHSVNQPPAAPPQEMRDFVQRARSVGFGPKTTCMGMASFEVTAISPFRGPSQDQDSWIECDANEVLMVLYHQHPLAYVLSHCREDPRCGWIPIQKITLAPYHEFLVTLPKSEMMSTMPLGLAFNVLQAKFGPALAVVHVQPNSILEAFNTRCRKTCPRNQVIPGDLITWVNNSSDPDEMRQTLVDNGSSASDRMQTLFLRVNRSARHAMSLEAPNVPMDLAHLLEFKKRHSSQPQPPDHPPKQAPQQPGVPVTRLSNAMGPPAQQQAPVAPPVPRQSPMQGVQPVVAPPPTVPTGQQCNGNVSSAPETKKTRWNKTTLAARESAKQEPQADPWAGGNDPWFKSAPPPRKPVEEAVDDAAPPPPARPPGFNMNHMLMKNMQQTLRDPGHAGNPGHAAEGQASAASAEGNRWRAQQPPAVSTLRASAKEFSPSGLTPIGACPPSPAPDQESSTEASLPLGTGQAQTSTRPANWDRQECDQGEATSSTATPDPNECCDSQEATVR